MQKQEDAPSANVGKAGSLYDMRKNIYDYRNSNIKNKKRFKKAI
jgi:hypothetical protein